MTMEIPTCAHVVATVDDPGAGPSYSVVSLVNAMAVQGAQASLHTARGWRAGPPNTEVRTPRHDHPVDRGPAGRWLCASSAMAHALARQVGVVDVLHTHGLWLMPNVYPSRIRRHSDRLRVVVSPRGMLGAGALRFSRTRKWAFWHAMQRRALETADCLHATSELEAQDIRAAGLRNPIAVIPNGIDLPDLPGAQNAPRGIRTALSLGRIHPKKGLDRLIRAWAEVEPRFPDWRLSIVGPAELNHDQQLRALARELSLQRVSVEGATFGAAKAAAYRDADLFVLPTLSENFAMTVAEALAAGTPVISTKGAPWAGLETESCGWWIDHGVAPLASTLEKAMTLPDATLRDMGGRGRSWMQRDFSWEAVGRDMLAAYAWLSARGERPDFIDLAPSATSAGSGT